MIFQMSNRPMEIVKITLKKNGKGTNETLIFDCQNPRANVREVLFQSAIHGEETLSAICWAIIDAKSSPDVNLLLFSVTCELRFPVETEPIETSQKKKTKKQREQNNILQEHSAIGNGDKINNLVSQTPKPFGLLKQREHSSINGPKRHSFIDSKQKHGADLT